MTVRIDLKNYDYLGIYSKFYIELFDDYIIRIVCNFNDTEIINDKHDKLKHLVDYGYELFVCHDFTEINIEEKVFSLPVQVLEIKHDNKLIARLKPIILGSYEINERQYLRKEFIIHMDFSDFSNKIDLLTNFAEIIGCGIDF